MTESPDRDGLDRQTEEPPDVVRVEETARAPTEIWAESQREGDRRLARSPGGMAATAVIGGADVMIGVLALVLATAAFEQVLPELTAHVLASLFFGIGFVFITIGRSELFTENFLVPVVAELRRRDEPKRLLRLWLISLIANLAAIAALAYLLAVENVLPEGSLEPIGAIAEVYAERSVLPAFLSAILAGGVMTLFTWFVHAAVTDIARIVISLLVGFILAVPFLNHTIVGFGEMILALATGHGHLGASDVFRNLAIAMLGNLVGGLGLVTLTRFWQVRGEPESDHTDQPKTAGHGTDRRRDA